MITKNYFIFFVVLVNLFLFLPSFQLALFGDDWLTLWRYSIYLGPKASGGWNHFTYLFTSYGPQDILMGLLQKVFGYQSIYYYLTSFILRLLAAFSLYPLIMYLTKNKLSAYFSITFFLVTTIGIETTNWVFNMPSYISIVFLNMKLKYEKKIINSRKCA